MFEICHDVIDSLECQRQMQASPSGALAVFEGWVRDHNEGHSVRSLEYEAFEELCQKEGLKVENEIDCTSHILFYDIKVHR